MEMTVRAFTNFAVPVFSTASWAPSYQLEVSPDSFSLSMLITETYRGLVPTDFLAQTIEPILQLLDLGERVTDAGLQGRV